MPRSVAHGRCHAGSHQICWQERVTFVLGVFLPECCCKARKHSAIPCTGTACELSFLAFDVCITCQRSSLAVSVHPSSTNAAMSFALRGFYRLSAPYNSHLYVDSTRPACSIYQNRRSWPTPASSHIPMTRYAPARSLTPSLPVHKNRAVKKRCPLLRDPKRQGPWNPAGCH